MFASNQKQMIRQSMQEMLAGLSAEEKSEQSEIIRTSVYEMILGKKLNKIAIFLPYPSEPDLTSLAEQVIVKGGTIGLPTINGGFSPVSSIDEVYTTHQWYKKTSSKDIVGYSIFDLVIVPGIAFTTEGKRLGRGSGRYDRTIALCRQQNPGTFIVGVCFSQQVTEDLPMEYYDQLMDLVVYPETL